MKISQTLFTTGLSFFVLTASAQEDASTGRIIDMTQSWTGAIGLEMISISRQAAREQYIDSSALRLNIEGEYFFTQTLSTTLGMGIISYDDNSSFSQRTEDNFGNVKNSESSANAVPFYAELGYKRFFSGEATPYITVRGGFSFIMGSERSIGNCSNCYSENIDIDGGMYALLGAGIVAGDSWSLGLHYKNYLSGDLESGIGLNISWGNF